MQRLEKSDQRIRFCGIQILSVGRHISAPLDYLANQLIRCQPDCNRVEGRPALAAISAEGVTVMTLLRLENQSSLEFKRSAVFQVLRGNRLTAPCAHYRAPWGVFSKMCQLAKRHRRHQNHEHSNRPASPALFALSREEWQQKQDEDANYRSDKQDRGLGRWRQ